MTELLKRRLNGLKKIETLCLSYFWGKHYFEDNDGTQNSLVFQVKEKYFKDNSGSDKCSIEIWKSKGLSNQSLGLCGSVSGADDIKMVKPIRPAYVIFNHKRSVFVQKKRKYNKQQFNSRYLYSIYTVFKKHILAQCLKKQLFGAIKVTKPNNSTNPVRYVYSGECIHLVSVQKIKHFI